MKTIATILQDIKVIEVTGNQALSVTDIQFDSRLVTPGCMFVAVKGTQTDGHEFIAKAIELGAVAIICEQLPLNASANLCFIRVANSAVALGIAASNFYGRPSAQLTLVGVTGTNGKTTTATLLYRLFSELGHKTGLISTVAYYVAENQYPSTHTTPDPIALNRLMAQMVEAGCSYCFMEVSSHALAQHRTAGLNFKGGLFTNITHDHLDYHKTFANYLAAKKMFFDGLSKDAFALVNFDDKNGPVMLQNCKANKYSYALRSVSDFRCKIIESQFAGMQLQIDGREVWTRFIGEFNAYNLLLVYGTAVLLEADRDEVLRIVSGFTEVSGRFETIRSSNGITAIVDYAHTPDALKNVLETINDIRRGDEQLITIAGAGGNRDKTKRPEMARIAVQFSDKLILTSDNPRNEKPEDIISDMMAGISAEAARKVVTIVDRREAIKTACMMANSGDIILVAGKGHETYQEVAGVKHHFDDKEELMKILL